MFMSYRISALLLAALIAMTGCSSMSKKECINANWYQLGFQDGRAGAASSSVQGYVQTCSKHDISINQTDYLDGHAEGIRTFCQPNNGYQIGLRGRSLPQVCPADMQKSFSEAHAKGYTEYKIKQDISAAEKAFANALKQQTQIENKLINATVDLYAVETGGDKTNAQQAVNELNSQIQTSIASQVVAVGQLACASGNWYRAGETDGLYGRSGSTYKRHIRQCESYHPQVNQSDYIKGQSAGLQQYCRYETGVELGQSGRALSNLCQGQSARNLKAGYSEGLKTYNETINIAGLQARKLKLESSAAPLLNKQAKIEADLLNENLTRNQKLELTRALNRVKFEIAQQESSLASTTNELNCYVADWEALGFESAEKGLAFDNQSNNCQQFGISVDTQQFERGYSIGLERYCTEANGRALGALGHEYQGICPQRLERSFLAGYQPAFNAFKRAELKKVLTIELSDSQKRLKNIQSEIDLLAQDLEQDGITRAEKLAIINEMSALNRQEKSLVTETELTSAHLQCLTDDWFGLGQSHGKSGQRNQLRALNCARFEETPNTTEYRNGLSRGLLNWCTQDNGYQMALAGSDASDACSRTTHRVYFTGYNTGIQELEIKKKIDALRLAKLDIIENQAVWEARIVEIDNALLNVNLSATKKRQLMSEKLKLQRQQLESETELEKIERDLLLLGG
jgi:ribosome modulation factor